MATTPNPPSSFSPPASTPSDGFSPTEWAPPQSFVSEILNQKGLLIGLGVAAAALFWFSRRSAPEEKAARRLVRDIRNVDDAGDVRNVLGSTVPTIFRPILLLTLEELERQVHRGFANLERELDRL